MTMQDSHDIKIKQDFLQSIPASFAKKKKEGWLVGLVVNAYDADAEWVKITFQNFDANYRNKDNSKIIIQDNGHGIDPGMLGASWFQYNKSTKAERNINKQKTQKGRFLTGGGGSGRFGISAIGRNVKVITRENKKKQYTMTYDFPIEPKNDVNMHVKEEAQNDNDDMQIEFGHEKKQWGGHGTIFEISNLNGEWDRIKFIQFCEKLIRRRNYLFTKKEPGSLTVCIYKDDKCIKCFTYSGRNKILNWLLIIAEHFLMGLSYVKIIF